MFFKVDCVTVAYQINTLRIWIYNYIFWLQDLQQNVNLSVSAAVVLLLSLFTFSNQ